MWGHMDAEHYRRKAQHYLMCAHHVSDPNARAALIELVVHWQQMAQANERIDRQQEDRQPAPFVGVPKVPTE
jgi:hypothetical protein